MPTSPPNCCAPGGRRSPNCRAAGRHGAPVTPQAAAAWVAEHQHQLGYIPDALTTSVPVPLTSGELAELLDLLRTIGPDKASRAGDSLPDRGRLTTPADAATAAPPAVRAGSPRRPGPARHPGLGPGQQRRRAEQIRCLTDDSIRERDWYVKLAERVAEPGSRSSSATR